MGLPALALTQHPLPNVDPSVAAAFASGYRALLDSVRGARPADGSEEERQALVEATNFGTWALSVLGLDVLRPGVQGLLLDLIQREAESTKPEAKLALRHVAHAIETYMTVIESFAPLYELDEHVLHAVREELSASRYTSFPEPERTVVRFQLDLWLALDCVQTDASLDEIAYWALRAATGARKVQAHISDIADRIRADLARIKAKHAWDDWDAADIAQELRPWPVSR